MKEKKIRYVSEWKPFSELKHIQKNISSLGYRKEYVEEHNLEKMRIFNWSSQHSICFFEPLEVTADGYEILYRENENRIHYDVPEAFGTQFGTFINHNNGEFSSWLEKVDSDNPYETSKTCTNDLEIRGNFCDMFDCGLFSYAISNLLHGGTGEFNIIRINESLV